MWLLNYIKGNRKTVWRLNEYWLIACVCWHLGTGPAAAGGGVSLAPAAAYSPCDPNSVPDISIRAFWTLARAAGRLRRGGCGGGSQEQQQELQHRWPPTQGTKTRGGPRTLTPRPSLPPPTPIMASHISRSLWKAITVAVKANKIKGTVKDPAAKTATCWKVRSNVNESDYLLSNGENFKGCSVGLSSRPVQIPPYAKKLFKTGKYRQPPG